jgi:trafficking protein particle complex subunit 1
MTLYSFFVYNKFGDCIYHAEWNRSAPSLGEGEKSLVAGLVYTLQHFSSQLSSTVSGGLKSMTTPYYRLHYLETMTKYRLVLTTDVAFDVNVGQQLLRNIFEQVIVEWVVKDPGYKHEDGNLAVSPFLAQKLKEFLIRENLLTVS